MDLTLPRHDGVDVAFRMDRADKASNALAVGVGLSTLTLLHERFWKMSRSGFANGERAMLDDDVVKLVGVFVFWASKKPSVPEKAPFDPVHAIRVKRPPINRFQNPHFGAKDAEHQHFKISQLHID